MESFSSHTLIAVPISKSFPSLPYINRSAVLPISKSLPEYISPGDGDANNGNSNVDGNVDVNNDANVDDSGDQNHNGDNSGGKLGGSSGYGDGISSGGGFDGKDGIDDVHRRLSGVC